MKGKKNLEKAILMGLLLSTSVYGTAFGAATNVKIDGDTLYLAGASEVLASDADDNYYYIDSYC